MQLSIVIMFACLQLHPEALDHNQMLPFGTVGKTLPNSIYIKFYTNVLLNIIILNKTYQTNGCDLIFLRGFIKYAAKKNLEHFVRLSSGGVTELLKIRQAFTILKIICLLIN
jgi:hypothetical protein